MPNTSASGGFIVPSPVPPADDDALFLLFQPIVVGITGLPGNLVRQSWQIIPPKQPEAGADWCAFGLVTYYDSSNISLRHDGAGDGSSTSSEQHEIRMDISFYGPHGAGYASQFRTGLMIAQNRELLFRNDISLARMPSEIASLPDLVNNVWINRNDMSAFFARKVKRVWPIKNMNGADVEIIGDAGTHNQVTIREE